MSENAIFPGDKIASIEEYEAGYNTFDDGDMVRAATIGQKDIDKSTRIANIKHPKTLSWLAHIVSDRPGSRRAICSTVTR